ncbi:hypothetical protein BWR18_10245 [Tateyamaria omphalii]|uniref:Aldehyde dehydrogenase domain-containing protein n=1 Tax=Tateyamaria omphalii TaxID=299262 RepID=A0A1P8MV85_9RHOB|nr:hypothetical protein BWR18_10245 [Tateyamaria omphalii]
MADGPSLKCPGSSRKCFECSVNLPQKPAPVICQRKAETLKAEMFGPVVSLLRFDAKDDAIAFANSAPFGQGSGILTENIAHPHVSGQAYAGSTPTAPYRPSPHSAGTISPVMDAKQGLRRSMTARAQRPYGSTPLTDQWRTRLSCAERNTVACVSTFELACRPSLAIKRTAL